MHMSRRQWLVPQGREVHSSVSMEEALSSAATLSTWKNKSPWYGIIKYTTWRPEVAPARVKCQAAGRVAALGAVSGIQEHALHADTPALSTSLRALLLVCKGSVGGLHTYGGIAERREVRRATRLLFRSQGGTGETA